MITLARWDSFARWANTRWKKRSDDYEAAKKKLSERLLEVVYRYVPQVALGALRRRACATRACFASVSSLGVLTRLSSIRGCARSLRWSSACAMKGGTGVDVRAEQL